MQGDIRHAIRFYFSMRIGGGRCTFSSICLLRCCYLARRLWCYSAWKIMYSMSICCLTHYFNLSKAMPCVLQAMFSIDTIYHCTWLPYAWITFAQYLDLYGKPHQTFSALLVRFRSLHTNNKCCADCRRYCKSQGWRRFDASGRDGTNTPIWSDIVWQWIAASRCAFSNRPKCNGKEQLSKRTTMANTGLKPISKNRWTAGNSQHV